MQWRRRIALCSFVLASALAATPSLAQLAPTGAHYGGRSSDTGHGGGVNSSGGYAASIPLDLPGARGGMPVPVQIVYGEHSVGAAGLGWNVPLSFIRREATFAYSRPLAIAGAAPQVRDAVSLTLNGRSFNLVRTPTGWAAQRDAPDLEIRQQGDTWLVFDGKGWTYTFAPAASSLVGSGIWHLASITGQGGNKVVLSYAVSTPAIAGVAGAVALDLTSVQYNNDPSGCFKNTVTLGYDSPAATPLSLSVAGNKPFVRMHKLTTVTVSGKATCGTSETIRSYQLSYQPDADTKLPQLASVQMTGRQGTPEATTAVPIGRYVYGSASASGQLNYALPDSTGTLGGNALGQTQSGPGPETGMFSFFTQQGLIDMNGDGRPDYILNNQILRNKSDGIGGQISFGEATSVLPDNANAFERQRSVGHRYDERPDEIRDNVTLSQAIDVNGDGRLDIIDASKLNQAWLIYLNTPDPNDPSKIVWNQRTYYTGDMLQRLRSAGAWTGDDHLPLALRTTGHDHAFRICVKWNGRAWVEFTDEPEAPGNCPEGGVFLSNGLEKTFTIWQLEDINGDGYPDFVFNSGHVVTGDENILPPPPTNPNNIPRSAQRHVTVSLSGGDNNAVQAQLNIFGVMTRNGGDEPYSAPVTIQRNTACGFSEWIETDADHQQLVCGIVDVNGDGLPDLVQGTSVLLGTGGRQVGDYFTGAVMTLPGPLGIQSNPQKARCAPPATGAVTFEVNQLAGLRDLTGDGLPDYVFQDGAGSWKVAMGTGVSFASAVPITGTFALSTEVEDCAGLTSKTTAGLFDLDGDGSPDVVGRTGSGTSMGWRRLVGSVGTKGALEAGRIVLLDNGYGALTRIAYQSAKEDKSTRHLVPFREIVVSSVSVSGSVALGGDLSPTRYAYGGAELLFDPAADRFTFRGYRRSIELQVPAGQSEGVARLSETYGPASVTDPFGLGGPGSPAASSTLARYRTYLTTGRPKDVTVISGALGSDPWSLLDPNNTLLVSRRVATSHYNWELRSLAKPSDPPGPEVCREMVFPYDRAASQIYAGGNGEWDLCAAHGFGFAVNVESRRTEPGADLASSSVVATRTEIQSVDDFGRVLSEKRLNDLNQPNDDLCVVTSYATPTGTNERVLGAASARSTTNCGSFTYAQDRWIFDGLAAGSVSAGFPTAHLVERRTDSGALERTIREFDATYDTFGNPLTMTTTREDGASRTATLTYDAFKLVPQTITTAATGVATTATSVARDPATLTVTSVTDANGTQHGSQLDGFLRPVLSTVTTPDGITGALSFTSYRGFSLTESGGRSVVRTEFTDPVAVAAAPTATGRRATVFLDELGRSMRAEVALGADYQNATLVAARRIYDSLGRVVFTADPFPSTQDFATAYGTTSIFNTDGTLSCSVRSKGRAIAPAATMLATDEANEFYPTCYTHVFQNKSEVTGVRDAASLLAGSPQEGVSKRSEATAIGRVVSRSTFAKNGSRIEHALLSYNALGRLSGMTRFQDAANAARPVSWEWHTDSLGQLRELDEPESVPQLSSYSDWGELTSVTRYIADGGGASLSVRATNATGPGDPPPPPPTVPLTILKRYDALGRLLHSEEQLNGVTDSATVNDYVYDTAVVAAPQVNATHVVGRLAQAISPTGAVSFSYDGFGQVNAQVFVDRRGGTYVEKHAFRGDGSAASLDLFLPDTTFADEHVDYQYDSAGRGRTVRYTSGSENRLLYSATNIDAFGRVRAATYGEASYAATYADLGRRLMTQASVTSASGSRVINYQSTDPIGRERIRSEVKNGAAPATSTFSYDPIGRLSTAVQVGGIAPFNQQFSYDSLGNILSLTSTGATPSVTSMTYTSNDGDRICSVSYSGAPASACNVGYDQLGNIAQQPTKTGSRSFSYYAAGSTRTISDGASSATFKYDAFGEVQELDLASLTALDVRQDRRYGSMIAVRKEDGASVITRTIPGPGGFVATRHGGAGSWTLAFREPRGTRFVTDEHGAFVQDMDYSPFGEVKSLGAQPGAALYTTEQWNGGDALGAFSLSQLGARLYDPVIGRFLSRDPLLIPRTAATTNPYSFAFNDPVNFSDPSGLTPEDCIDRECVNKEPDTEPAQIGHSENSYGPFVFPPGVTLYHGPHNPVFEFHEDNYVPPPLAVDVARTAALIEVVAKTGLEHSHSEIPFWRECAAVIVQGLCTGAGAAVGGYFGGQVVAGATLGNGIGYAAAQWIRGEDATISGEVKALAEGLVVESGLKAAGAVLRGTEALLADAFQLFKGGSLTGVGRALTKHPEVLGYTKETLRKVLRTDAEINAAAAGALETILQGSKQVVTIPRYGVVLEFRGANGFGARFYEDTGKFIGFINP